MSLLEQSAMSLIEQPVMSLIRSLSTVSKESDWVQSVMRLIEYSQYLVRLSTVINESDRAQYLMSLIEQSAQSLNEYSQ